MTLKIILHAAGAPLTPCLETLPLALAGLSAELYCLCADESEAQEVTRLCRKLAPQLGTGAVCFGVSVAEFANRHLPDKSGYLLFLASNIIPGRESISRMLACLAADSGLAGVNPVLLADWLVNSEARVAFMGLAFDYQKKLHFLYEGMLRANPLVDRQRFFQIAHPGCLLLRCADFQAGGGLRPELGFLSFPAFCLTLLQARPKGYACVAAASCQLRSEFDSWNFCGAWDSILQRGRLETGNILSDYADFCRADGLEYGCDSWLCEGPAQIPDPAPPLQAWQEWRYHPRPVTLLAYLAGLAPAAAHGGIELARNRPASLPQTLQYYRAQAEKIRALGKDCAISAAAGEWLARSRRFHYGELRPGIELLQKAGIYNCALDICPAIFDAWVETSEKFARIEVGADWPEIAVAMPVWNPEPDFLRQAIESVRCQTYRNWQLCIADDASTRSEIRPLLENFASADERIRVTYRTVNGHICAATNNALAMVTAPFTALLDHDDLLAPHALAEVARLVAQKPGTGFIYSDDDRINTDNVRRNPVFKPDFDRDLFFTWHLSVYATGLLRQLGGLRLGTEGAQDQDLRFRAAELLSDAKIAHIAKILYHWRVHEDSTASSVQAKPYVREAGRKVALEAACRQGRRAEWGGSARQLARLLYYPARRCACAVVLLLADVAPSDALLAKIRELGEHFDSEIYLQPLLADSPRLRSYPVLPRMGGVAQACNAAAARLAGDVLLFLAADLVPDGDCRLEQLLELAMVPHIAMASGNIWSNARLVSGGWYPDATGLPFQLLQGMPRSEVQNSVWGQMCLPRHVLGAPLECMAVRKEFCRSGDFLDERFGALASVDFGLRVMAQNKFVAMNPWVNWQARKAPVAPAETEYRFVLEQWGTEIAGCGLRNANLRAAPDNDWTLIFD